MFKTLCLIEFSRICPHGPAARTLLTLPWNPFDPRFSRSPSAGRFFENNHSHKHAIAATREGLRDLAPWRRRASEGSQAGGIRRFAARGTTRGRLGSVLEVGKRRGRVRGRFHRQVHISTGPQHCADQYHDPLKFWIQSSLESPKHCRMRRKRLPDPRPIPEGVQEPNCIRKK